jgi:hypothetical protein
MSDQLDDFLDLWLEGKRTEQAYYALVAYHRFQNNQSSLYNMDDTEKVNVITVKTDRITKDASASKAQTVSIGAKATAGTLTYQSNNSKITVSNEGVITISKNYAGSAKITITARASGYKKATKTIIVTVNQIKGKVSASNVVKTTKTAKQTVSLKATGSGTLTYSSNNKSVTVKNGQVTIAKNFVGQATITVKAAASGIYQSASKKITVTVNPTGVKLSKLSNEKGKKLTVTWKKNAQVTGYQVQCATDKNFKTIVKKVTSSKTSTTISGLKKGKTYYVRIRTYKKVSGNNYYSSWSSSMKKTITK